MFIRLIILALSVSTFLLSSVKLYAQTQNTFSGWGAVFGSFKIKDRFSLHFDGQVRSSHEWREMQSILIRPGVHYRVNKNMIATVGYAYVAHHRRINEVSGWAPEHRIWEQYIINQSFNIAGHATALQHRFRLEQRFISTSAVDNDKLTTTGFNFAQRLRYFARAVIPLQQTKKFTKGTFISLQDELFVNIGDASATNGKFFDQNRAYASLGYRFSPAFDLEAGYMNQYISGKVSNTSNNILQVAGYVRL